MVELKWHIEPLEDRWRKIEDRRHKEKKWQNGRFRSANNFTTL